MIDEESGQILGAHILAPQAGELINLLALAALQGISAQDFAEIPWAYPTYTADLKYMLGEAWGSCPVPRCRARARRAIRVITKVTPIVATKPNPLIVG